MKLYRKIPEVGRMFKRNAGAIIGRGARDLLANVSDHVGVLRS